MSRVYLEIEPVVKAGFDTGRFHLYLVRRPDPAPGDVNSLTWRSNGEVLRGGVDNPLGGPITVETGPLSASKDAYSSQADIAARRIFDVTDAVGGDAGWNTMAATLAAIASAGYKYELPFGASDAMDHVANSDATALTLLNSVGVDVRSLIGNDPNIPGAGIYATLLATGSDPIAASASLKQPLTFLGRDNVGDTFLGRAYGDRYYGEQSTNGSAVDTVNYSGVDRSLVMILDGTVKLTSQVTVNGTNGSDQLVGIEKIVLSTHNDTVTVSHSLPQGIQEIDGGGVDSGGQDTLDLRGADEKLTFTDDHIVGSSTIFKGFQVLKVDPGDDTVNLEGESAKSWQEVDFGDGNDTINSSVDNLKINFGNGNDTASISGSGVTVNFGNGNDTLKSSGKGDIVKLGKGVDTIELSHNGQILIENANTSDHLTYYGSTLHGGVRWGGSESVYAYGIHGERYGRN